jgi:hypothetical protein
MSRVNCWESMNCGKEKTCPAYPDYGRNCFGVEGTQCMGETQGGFNDKISQCRKECNFFQGMMNGDC